MADGARWDSAYHAPVLAAEIVRLLAGGSPAGGDDPAAAPTPDALPSGRVVRSEEHTSELQSLS